MKNTSLKSAILIPVTIVLVVVIVAEVILLGSLSAKEAGTLTANIVQEAVSHYAANFESTGIAPYSAVLAVAPVIKDLARSDNGREQAGRVLQAVLAENDDFTSIWTCWEPNAFDGKDSQYRGKANHDGTGRFALNVYRNSAGIYSEVLTQYDTGEFYQGAKQTKQVYVTDPYFYSQGGKEVVLYSITVPILENGVFVGAVGIEVDLDKVSAKMNKGSLLKEGYVFTLSPGGIITTHPNPDYLMVHYKDTWMQQYDQQLQELSRVEGRLTERSYSTVLGKDILLAVENVQIGGTGRYWTICGVVPQTAVLRSSYFLIKVLTGVSVLLVVFVLVTIRAIINKRLHELPQILKMADSLVAGEVEDITVERCETTEKSMKNEIRLIELAFQRIARTTKGQVEILQRIAAGDLSVQVTPNSQRDLLNQALKELVESNNTVFKQIVLSAQQVEVGASQMADGAQLLAQASMEQTTSIERLTRSLGEIEQEAGSNEEIANNAAEMSNGIAKIAQQGTGHMEQMIRAVSEINEASKSINSVIKVIDDIAFQTNILALNAAVEAARAGQYGKGFAVVAEEVRSLAAKSAEAAKDTNRLIKNSIEKAELGASIATETAEILDQIAQGIDESSQAVSGIVPLARNQGNGIKTVNHGIEQIVQAAQQNSAIAEESAAGSEQMRGQARLLKDMVAQFKLKDGPERPLPLYESYSYDADINETAFKL